MAGKRDHEVIEKVGPGACQHTHFMGQPAGRFTTEVIGGARRPISAPPPGTLPRRSLAKKEGMRRGEAAKRAGRRLRGTPGSSRSCHVHV